MMELISKREVLRIIEEETIDDEYECEDGSWESYIDFQYADAVKRINELPTIESRPKGEWEKTMTYYPYCSICEWIPEEDEMTHGLYNYCPNCGADMRGAE